MTKHFYKAIILGAIVLASGCASVDVKGDDGADGIAGNSAQSPQTDVSNFSLSRDVLDAMTLSEIIYKKDVAAWVATDAMLEELGPTAGGLPLRGWITTRGEVYGNWDVHFIGQDDDVDKVFYHARTRNGEVLETTVFSLENAPGLSPVQTAMWSARQTASEANFMTCSDKYNTVVVTPEESGLSKYGDNLIVYLFAATVEDGKVPLGGHHRMLLDPSGTNLLEQYSFTKSCLTLDTKPEADARPMSLMTTHINSTYPQEHHMFLVKSHKIPMYVMTVETGKLWVVEGNNVRIIKENIEP